MKIALTGAHGVGKSTLAMSLQQQLKAKNISVIVTPEVPRMICDLVDDKEFFRRSNNTLLKQSLIMVGQLVIEEQNKGYDIQICDRTLFDHWAYSLSMFEDELNKNNLCEVFEKFITDHCFTYDKIFYIPNEIKPIDDGTRESDLAFQANIDLIITQLLNKHNIAYK